MPGSFDLVAAFVVVEHLDDAGLVPVAAGYFTIWQFPPAAGVRTVKDPLRIKGVDDGAMPPAALNRMLTAVFASARGPIGRSPLPFGLPILMICRKPPAD